LPRRRRPHRKTIKLTRHDADFWGRAHPPRSGSSDDQNFVMGKAQFPLADYSACINRDNLPPRAYPLFLMAFAVQKAAF
jgi:hypothetical protein